MPTATTARSCITQYLTLIGFFALTTVVCGCGLLIDNEDKLDRGAQAFADGDFRAAMIDAKDVLLDDPQNLRGRILLGRAAVEIGDGETAEKELNRALELGAVREDIIVDVARALLLQRKYQEVLDAVSVEGVVSDDIEVTLLRIRGDAYAGLNQYELAREMYLSVLGSQPQNLDAQLGITSTYIADQNFIQARATIEHILGSYPDEPRVWLYSGAFNMIVRDYDAARANFDAALELANSQGDETSELKALGGLAESLLEQDKVESARTYVEQLVVRAPETFQTNFLLARVAYEDEDWTAARQSLQQILQAAPDFRPAQVLLGAVNLQSGNLSQAEMYLAAAVVALPEDVRARQLLAETRIRMKKIDGAQEALAPIVSGSNPDVISLQMAARASLGRQDIDGALDYLRLGVEAEPDNVELSLQLAASLMQVGRADEAQQLLDAVDVSGSPEHAYRRDALGVLKEIRAGNMEAALASANQVAEGYSNRPNAHNLLGTVQLAAKDTSSAKSSFERALQLEPTDILSRRYLAAINESVGDLVSAERIYDEILTHKPDAAWAMSSLARIAFQRKDHEQAVEKFRRALEMQPDNPNYRLNVAKAERRMGNGDKAMQVLADQMDASLEHVESALMLGTLKAEAGDVTGALDIADMLVDRYPDNPVTHALKGDIFLSSGDLKRADDAYGKALLHDPSQSQVIRAYRIKQRLGQANAEQPLVEYLETRPLDNNVRMLLAESYLQTDVSSSILAYERALSDSPDNAVVLNNLAWAYYLAGDSRAIETARRALDAMPDNGAIVDTVGWITIELGSVAEGEVLLRRAVEMENGRPEISYHHAVALARLGRKDEARVVLQQILSGDEKFDSRKDAEALLIEL